MDHGACSYFDHVQDLIYSKLRGEPHELGNHTVDHFDSDVDRCHSELAAQQELGLWTQRRVGIGRDHHSDPALNGATVIGDSYPLGRQTMRKPAFRI